MNQLATLELALQQPARLEDELAPDGALPGPLMLAPPPVRALAPRVSNAIAVATLRPRRSAGQRASDRDHDRLPPS